MAASLNIRDVLTSFSPSLDYFAISSGDGRIKIWDTVKGQVQTEFADLMSTETSTLLSRPEGNPLSVDYTCMKWLSLDKKRKRKIGTSLLVLGTGSGDVLALDVPAGQLKWRVSDCHPGGVSSISLPAHGTIIYTAGADGMVCELESTSGNLLRKFRASTKAISSISISSDGKLLATAAAQLKIFSSSDQRKIQKFSGHPGAVRCMLFSEDGRYVLSSAVAERYVAVWKIDGSKKKSACCFLAMDHPAVLLDCRCIDTADIDGGGLSVVAISEMGVCYFWYGKDIEELRDSKPTKISVSQDEKILRKQKGARHNIFAAKLQTVPKSASGQLFIAYGLLIKPVFEKILVQSGMDIKLNTSIDGILLPISRSHKSAKVFDGQRQVTALDRANAEDALLPIPKVFDLIGGKTGAQPVVSKDNVEEFSVDVVSFCMEDELRSLGILSRSEDLTSDPTFDSDLLKIINLEVIMPPRKMKSAVLSMEPDDAYKLLTVLVAAWKSRSRPAAKILPWIHLILVYHHDYVTSQEPATQLIDSLYKLSKSKDAALQPLLQLSGRLQLVIAQIDRAANTNTRAVENDMEEDESEDEDVEDALYGVEEESQNSSDNDD